MKIAIISDTHWGVRNDSRAFIDYFDIFYSKCFFPTLEEHGVKQILHLGDLVDRRKFINNFTAHKMCEIFFDKARDLNIKVDVLLGNHDVFYKNTNKVSIVKELTMGYDNVRVFDQAVELVYDETKILGIPWITTDNRQHTFDLMKTTDAQIAMGHLELSGFEMYKGAPSQHGDDPADFGRFDIVLSGHFHTKSKRGNIEYLGAPCEYTWSDYNDPRGFHIFDTETRELTFIQNPYSMFMKIFYDDSGKSFEELMDVDFERFYGAIVKVVVKNKDNHYFFDQFIDKIERAGPIDLQVVEDHLNLIDVADEEIVSEAESTLCIFEKHIDLLTIGEDEKTRLKSTIASLYEEALSIE